MTGLRATRSFVSDFMRRTRPAAISRSAVTISRFFVWSSGLVPWKICRARFDAILLGITIQRVLDFAQRLAQQNALTTVRLAEKFWRHFWQETF